MNTNDRGDSAPPKPPAAPAAPAPTARESAVLIPHLHSSHEEVEITPDLGLFRGNGFFLGSGN